MSKRKKLTYDEAVAMLPNKENIHTFIGRMFLIGADWSRKDILSLLKNAVQIELSGQTATAMGHRLGVWRTERDVIFVETANEYKPMKKGE